jgi:Flp pilus assembly protein TadB
MMTLYAFVGIISTFGFLLAFDTWRAKRAETRSNRIMDEWAAHEFKLKNTAGEARGKGTADPRATPRTRCAIRSSHRA